MYSPSVWFFPIASESEVVESWTVAGELSSLSAPANPSVVKSVLVPHLAGGEWGGPSRWEGHGSAAVDSRGELAGPDDAVGFVWGGSPTEGPEDDEHRC